MPISKDKSNEANKNYWRFVEETSLDVAKWPAWLRVESNTAANPLDSRENQNAERQRRQTEPKQEE
jgi:hypothetical protein